MARRSDNTERRHVITLLERVDRTHDCARSEASGAQTRRIHDGVRVEAAPATLVDRTHMLQQCSVVHPKDLIVANHPRYGRIDRIDHPRTLDTIERSPEPIRSFWMGGAGHMVEAAFITQQQEHPRSVPPRPKRVSCIDPWGCTH